MLPQRWFGGLVLGLGIALMLGLSVLASPLALTVTSYSDLIRFAVQGDVTELRVQVFSLAGHTLVDSGFIKSTALDWQLGDQHGRRVSSGVYLYVVTLKDTSGKLSKQLGKLAVVRGQVGAGSASGLAGHKIGELLNCTIDCEPPTPRWQELLDDGGADNFRLLRSGMTLLTLDNVGRLSVPQVCLTGDCRSVWPAGGTLTSLTAGSGLTGGTITSTGTIAVDTAVIQARVTGTCATGNAIRVIDGAGGVSCETIPGPFSGWMLAGNSGTTAGTNFIGTTDNVALELKVNNARALRLEPNVTSPNIIGGFSGNSVPAGVVGATIAGGGQSPFINSVTANFGTVGGGRFNTASGFQSTVGGGSGNTASGDNATTVGGGTTNTASVNFATVGGGLANTASGDSSTVGGGRDNTASDSSTVGGGAKATPPAATLPRWAGATETPPAATLPRWAGALATPPPGNSASSSESAPRQFTPASSSSPTPPMRISPPPPPISSTCAPVAAPASSPTPA